MNINLYQDSNDKSYYWNSPNVTLCDVCSVPINDIVYWRIIFDKNFGKITQHFCQSCSNKVDGFRFSQYGETNFAVVVSKVPRNAMPYIHTPTLSPIGSAMDLVLRPSNNVVDKTVYAGKESWSGAAIGADVTKKLEKLDKPLLTDKELDSFFVSVKNSVPIIEYDEKKQLESKNRSEVE